MKAPGAAPPGGDEAGSPEVLLAYVTVPDEAGDGVAARALARALVEQGLAAGVNVLCGARSVYRWRGEIREAGECLLLAQVAAPAFAAFRAGVVARHPHVTPCILGLAVAAGHAPFVRWIRENSAAENSAENS